MKITKSYKSFGGTSQFCEHESSATASTMKFSLFVPPGPIKGCLFWLSGLTCTEENFMSKAGAQRYLAEAQILLVCPDTSPRGLGLPGVQDAWDFGEGAGFYVDAETAGFNKHYRMYSYILDDLLPLVKSQYPSIEDRIGIFGHSMGGHGALVLGLRNPKLFRSVSAFAPIANPLLSAWGQKAFRGYLGPESKLWNAYDATDLLASGYKHPSPLLIDQGTEDQFLKDQQLLPENLLAAAQKSGQKIEFHLREGYDHSYYFIASFVADHIAFHAKRLALQS